MKSLGNTYNGGKPIPLILTAIIFSFVGVASGATFISEDYTLTSDMVGVSGTTIIAQGGNLTIDGQGHTIHFIGVMSNNAVGIGCYADNITIKNVTIRGFNTGIRVWGNNLTLINCRIEDCAEAALDSLAGNHSITQNVFKNNQNLFRGQFTGSTFSNNSIIGGRTISAFPGARPTTIQNCIFRHMWTKGPLRFNEINRYRSVGNTINFTARLYDLDGNTTSQPSVTVRTVPSESVNYSKSGSSVTGSFSPSRNGLYSIIARSTDSNGNVTERAQRIFVGPTVQKSIQYYVNNLPPTHGQTVSHTSYDSRGLDLTPPTEIGRHDCGGWIQQSPEQIPPSPAAIITQGDLSFRMKFVGDYDGQMMIERDVKYGVTSDLVKIVDKSLGDNTYKLLEATFSNLNWMMDYPHNWHYLGTKFYAWQPWMEVGNPQSLSGVKYHYKVPTSPEITSSSNHQILILGSTTDPNNPNSVIITVAELETGHSGDLILANFSRAIKESTTTISPGGLTARFSMSNLNGEKSFTSIGLSILPTGGDLEVAVTNWPTGAETTKTWTEKSLGGVTSSTHTVSGLQPGTFYDIFAGGNLVQSGSADTFGNFSFTYSGSYGTQAVSFKIEKKQINTPPIITAGPNANPNPVIVGQSVTFSISATDADNDPLTYSWDFGDGNTSNEQNPSYTYSSAGTYAAVVTVSDNRSGSANDSISISVQNSPPPPPPPPPGELSGHWKVDETFGQTAFDSSGNNNHGALKGNPQWNSQGKFGGALHFDGNDYVEAPHSSSLAIAGDATFACWVKFDVISGRAKLFNKKSSWSANAGYLLEVWTDNNSIVLLGKGTSRATASLSLTTDWQHIAASINGGTVQMYYNGNPVPMSDATITPILAGTEPLKIGRSLKGLMDDIRIYNRTLSDSEIADLAGNVNPPPPDNNDPTIDSNPTANPNPAGVNQVVAFSVSASDIDNDLLSYNWDFGDGTNGAGSNPNHSYTSPGSYTASVTATDNKGGSANASVTVTVQDLTAPTINISSTVIKGTVSDSSGVSELRVNGAVVQVNADGSWEKEVNTPSPTTNVNIQATDSEGNTTTKTITVSK